MHCCAVQAAAQHQISEAYKRDLLGQIQAHAEAKRAERTSYLEEGKKIRQAQQQEKASLEEVRRITDAMAALLQFCRRTESVP
jgi:hypothetical protein